MAARPRTETLNTEDPRGQFGQFLRHWIDKHHDGDETRLANTLGLSDRAIRKWMQGSSGPAFSDLGHVAKALGFSDWAAMARAVIRFARG